MNEKQYLDVDTCLVQTLSNKPQSKLSEYTYLYTVIAKPQSRSKIYLKHTCGRVIHIERTDIKKEKNYARPCMCESHTSGVTFEDACASKGISGWVHQPFRKTKKKQELFPNFPYSLDNTLVI